MITALIGAPHTGKSTVYRELQPCLPTFTFLAHDIERQVRTFGYRDTTQLTRQVGVGISEILHLQTLSTTDPQTNNLLAPETNVIIDGSAIDYYASYLASNNGTDRRCYPLAHQMAMHYASLIDQIVYFPVGRVPLGTNDSLFEWQSTIDHSLQRALQELGVSEHKVHNLRAISVHERVAEILGIVPLPSNWTDELFANLELPTLTEPRA